MFAARNEIADPSLFVGGLVIQGLAEEQRIMIESQGMTPYHDLANFGANGSPRTGHG